ncbi:hypothetical protein M3231_20020 [Neobacillus mesonae]|nr:hypothetical protein [Neobacillus mesonae]
MREEMIINIVRMEDLKIHYLGHEPYHMLCKKPHERMFIKGVRDRITTISKWLGKRKESRN